MRAQSYATALIFLAACLTLPVVSALAQAPEGTPLTIEDCENSRPCGTMLFHGVNGQGAWPDEVRSDLSLEQFTEIRVIIHRTDTGGPTKGLKATYKGYRKGDQIEGTLTWSWPGHFLLSKGINGFHATIQSLPSEPQANPAPEPPGPPATPASPKQSATVQGNPPPMLSADKASGTAVPAGGVQAGQSAGPICYRFAGFATKTGGAESIPVKIAVNIEKIPAPHIERGSRAYMFDNTGATASAGAVKGFATVRFGKDVTNSTT